MAATKRARTGAGLKSEPVVQIGSRHAWPWHGPPPPKSGVPASSKWCSSSGNQRRWPWQSTATRKSLPALVAARRSYEKTISRPCWSFTVQPQLNQERIQQSTQGPPQECKDEKHCLSLNAQLRSQCDYHCCHDTPCYAPSNSLKQSPSIKSVNGSPAQYNTSKAFKE
eukprot:1152051-Pelagomonas_calceolata.AAC.1